MDFVVDTASRKKVKNILIRMGYDVHKYGGRGHDIYYKQPIYNVEVHDYFVEPDYKEWNEFFSSRIIQESHSLEENDFYIHLIAHAYKHYSLGGTGIRTVMDIYVYRKNHHLDENYIQNVLNQFNLFDFEKEMVLLGKNWFEKQNIDQTNTYILNSGTYGTQEQYMHNEIKKHSKLGYIKKRIFPSLESMSDRYTFLLEYRWLLPLCWVHRWMVGLVLKQKTIRKEFKMIHKNK